MIRTLLHVLILFLAWGSHAHAEVKESVLEFSNLPNWTSDAKSDALTAFLETCPDLKSNDWTAICAVGQHTTDADTFFKPIKIETADPSLLTRYFELELQASRTKTGRFVYPIYQKPSELPKRGWWLTRAEVEDTKVMENRGLEIAWLDDPVDLFFLQVQGSGRLRMQDGTIVRIGYAAKNGHKYRSVGKEPLNRLMIAQDTGSVIKGAQRADIFVGSGPKAGKDAGRIKNSGSLYVLLPIKRALALSRG